jgi:hypothetical protein
MARKKTLLEFIKEANKVHNSKYDYSKVDYINNKKEVCIICPIHGEFYQSPISHLKGNGCQKCNGGVRDTTEAFIEKARKYTETNMIIQKWNIKILIQMCVLYVQNMVNLCKYQIIIYVVMGVRNVEPLK